MLLTRDDIDAFKAQLLDMQEELKALSEAFTASADTVTLDQSRVGRLSRMDALQAQQMALEAERRRQLQLIRITGALRRIDTDNFGLCFVCGEGIDRKRLVIDPTHTRCIGCMEEGVQTI